MTEYHTKVLVLGTGAAGCTAAIYAARANLSPILLTGMQPGGQLTITTDVENYPGFAEPISGPVLMDQMQEQAKNVGAKLINDTAAKVDLSNRPFKVEAESGDVYFGETLVVATGASARWLNMPSEQKFRGFGVSACATCDGFFYRDKNVCVVGGGNTAVEEAIFLTNFAKKVTLIHRRDELRAEKIMQERLFKNSKIEMCWDSVLDEVLGDDNPPGVTAIQVKNVKTGATRQLPMDGVFIAIGHDPNTALFKDQLELDAERYLVTRPNSTVTNVPGVFAAGDVKDKVFRQAITAAGSGCMAAIEADRFLAAQG